MIPIRLVFIKSDRSDHLNLQSNVKYRREEVKDGVRAKSPPRMYDRRVYHGNRHAGNGAN